MSIIYLTTSWLQLSRLVQPGMASAKIPPWLCGLHEATDVDQCGGKAAGLAMLARAGLPVPPAVVVTHAAFLAIVQPGPPPGPLPSTLARPIPTATRQPETSTVTTWAAYWSDLAQQLEHVEIAASLLHELVTQATPWHDVAVRSSMAVEDGAQAAAPGLFASKTHVPVTTLALADALRAVWASACTPMVGQYLARHDASVGRFTVAAIVQQFIVGERLVIYTRPPGAATETTALLQRNGSTRRLARDDATEPALRLALAAEIAIGAQHGADVELVQQPDGTLWVEYTP